ncbi:MAG: Gfo/Idh/MocA family oxidoreductase [Bacteroidales bacterium]|nr:Gfo/Idh/MocA family oxidoreductase [Bacteroidales bacterium]MCF8390446.1 Gfo/Idh/MocA family oxidoreductase [Bacteroidales bacterium]
MQNSRRKFIKKVAIGSSAIAIGGIGAGFSASSYSRIMGANDRIVMGIMGTNGRGKGMAANFALQKNTEVRYICDVEEKALAKGIDAVNKAVGISPKAITDIRKMLELKDMDAVYLAPPDHWHAPATIMSCVAGKHVYVEKPLSHNPAEGEMAIRAARKYDRVVQMGSQRRSWKLLTEGINELKNGVIGKAYMAKTWYTNNRKSIGIGKVVPVPSNLDYELWQGPAPRLPYKDNLIHYNWHWFWNWGTGEALNNGTHEIDVARWGLGIDFPAKVFSVGGRYHYKDDWEAFDTQLITYESDKGASIIWEGRSCNGNKVEGLGRGVIFYGENGSLHTGHDGYTIYDMDDKLVKEVSSDVVIDGRDTSSPAASLDSVHIENFLNCIRTGGKLNADVETGHKSTTWVQLGNISQRVGRGLAIDPKNGHIKGDDEAEKLWGREYEPGWEPKF